MSDKRPLYDQGLSDAEFQSRFMTLMLNGVREALRQKDFEKADPHINYPMMMRAMDQMMPEWRDQEKMRTSKPVGQKAAHIMMYVAKNARNRWRDENGETDFEMPYISKKAWAGIVADVHAKDEGAAQLEQPE